MRGEEGEEEGEGKERKEEEEWVIKEGRRNTPGGWKMIKKREVERCPSPPTKRPPSG